jgi:hypothetical protein
MSLKSIVSIFALSLLLVACAGPVSTIIITDNPAISAPTANVLTPYPEPAVIISVPTLSAYPEPSTPSPSTPLIPPSGYEPQPGDENLKRSQVFLELASSKLVVNGTGPLEVSVILNGNLPDPCHQLRVVVMGANENNSINLEVYSLAESGKACITVLEPFEVSIPLGSYSDGHILVYVNHEVLGEFGTGYEPQPGDDQLTRDEVSLDMNRSKLVTSDTQPVQLSAMIKGTLPDPCHQLRAVLSGPDENNAIYLEVYSLVDTSIACITVLKPFEATIPLGSVSSGHFTVVVNGQILGDFDG